MPNNEYPVPDKKKVLLSIAALSCIKGVGFKTITGLYDRHMLTDVWDLSQQEIEKNAGDLTQKHCPQFAKIITETKSQLLDLGMHELENLHEKGIIFVLKDSAEYPSSLLRLSNPPRWLFVKGNLPAVHAKGIVGIIGSRDASHEGHRIARALAREMVTRNLVVLSGLAKGIDIEAHQGAIEYFGQTIGVLGHGFQATYGAANNQLWPEIIERDGAVVTEYFLNDTPSRETFLRRNEIQAALSNIIIPVECPDLSSGTGATIRRALSISTPVVGVFWENLLQNDLLKTRENLNSLNIPVFLLPNQSNAFWDFIKSVTEAHDWSSVTPGDRQNRFRRIYEEDIVEKLKRASFDGESIEKWSSSLKDRLRKDQNK